jgi:hypothetical protein
MPIGRRSLSLVKRLRFLTARSGRTASVIGAPNTRCCGNPGTSDGVANLQSELDCDAGELFCALLAHALLLCCSSGITEKSFIPLHGWHLRAPIVFFPVLSLLGLS